MPMRSSNWAELLLPTIYNFYDIGRTLRPELRPQIFNVQTSSRADERNVGYGGIAPNAWDNYEASGVKGATLDISGTTGAMTVTTSSNADVTVYAPSTADEETLVMITHGEHADN